MSEICGTTLKHLKMHKTLDNTSQTTELTCERINIFGIELYDAIFNSLEIHANSRHRSFEFMTHISEKLCTNTLLMIEAETEIIERINKWSELILSLIVESFPS